MVQSHIRSSRCLCLEISRPLILHQLVENGLSTSMSSEQNSTFSTADKAIAATTAAITVVIGVSSYSASKRSKYGQYSRRFWYATWKISVLISGSLSLSLSSIHALTHANVTRSSFGTRHASMVAIMRQTR